MSNQLHELFIYRTVIQNDEQNQPQIWMETKYRNEVLPLEDHAGDFVSNINTNNQTLHMQNIPLVYFNQILTYNNMKPLTDDQVAKLLDSRDRTLLTNAKDNLAFQSRVITNNGVEQIALDSITETTHPFYYKLEKVAEDKMRHMHIG